MALKVGINGFGRIGRIAARIMLNDPDIELVACNDFSNIEAAAHLLKYDSVHGKFNKEIEIDGTDLIVDGKRIKGLSTRDPLELNWKELGVDVVCECTGRFKTGEQAGQHIKAGASRVAISAPGKDVDATIVMGVNDNIFDPSKHFVVSNASCTTNCLAPLAKVLVDEFGIEQGYMTTVHAYTNDQKILDLKHKDLRRARAAAMSIIPTTTGAARAVAEVIPELKGKLDGMAARVPTPDASMVDLVVQLSKKTSTEELNAVIKAAAQGAMKGYIEYSEDPIVSCDIIGNPASCIFDAPLTMVNESGSLAKLIAWYDNEYGYSMRLVDLVKLLGSK